MDISAVGLLVLAAVCVLIGVLFFRPSGRPRQPAPPEAEPPPVPAPARAAAPAAKAKAPLPKRDTHPLLCKTLKGHADAVSQAAFSPDGKLLVSASGDRTLRVYETQSLPSGDGSVKRVTVDLDHVRSFGFAEDGASLVAATGNGKRVLVYSVGQKGSKLTLATEFQTGHKDDIVSVGTSAQGRFVVTTSCDTELRVFSTAGKAVQTIDTRAMVNYMSALSPDGRFLAVATYMTSAKVYECKRGRSGELLQVEQVMDLSGHKARVNCVSFGDATTVATACNDGTVNVYSLAVRYEQREDPRILCHVETGLKAAEVVALSSDTRLLAVSGGTTIVFYAVAGKNRDELARVEHAHDGKIVSLSWMPDARLLASASTANDGVKLWKNPLQ